MARKGAWCGASRARGVAHEGHMVWHVKGAWCAISRACGVAQHILLSNSSSRAHLLLLLLRLQDERAGRHSGEARPVHTHVCEEEQAYVSPNKRCKTIKTHTCAHTCTQSNTNTEGYWNTRTVSAQAPKHRAIYLELTVARKWCTKERSIVMRYQAATNAAEMLIPSKGIHGTEGLCLHACKLSQSHCVIRLRDFMCICLCACC